MKTDKETSCNNGSEKVRPLWVFVTFIVLISALGSFVNDMFTPAMPEMCKFFHTTTSVVQMGLTMGMIGLSIGQFFLGPISDKYGRKPVLLGSMSLFLIAAVISIFSTTIHFFLICRLIQGIGASGAYLLGRSMPADRYSGEELAKIMALIGAINGFAPASAPVLGGITAHEWGWRGIFVVLSIFTALLLIFSFFIKETLAPCNRSKGSWIHAFDGYKILLTNRHFMVHVCMKGISLGLLFAYISAAPFILENTYGYTETEYGLIIGGNALFMISASILAPKFHPFKKANWIGTWFVVVGILGLSLTLWFVKNFWLLEFALIITLFGLGLIFTVTNTLAMNEGRNHAGDASSILGIMGYIVGAIVSPLVGIGNVEHSTAIAGGLLTILIIIFAFATRKIAPDLNAP